MENWLVFIPIGMVVGTLSGLFGIGGGVVMVPAIFFFLNYLGVSEDQAIITASRTSLGIILFTSLAAARNHHKKAPLDIELLKELIIFVITGTILGNFIVHAVSPQAIKIILMVYIFLIGLKMWFGFKPKPSSESVKPPLYLNLIIGNIIGLKSAVLGIGGGTISVPYLTWQNVKMTKAAGISAAIGFTVAFTTTATELVRNFGHLFEKPLYMGPIYLPALLGILSTSIIFTKLGTKLGHKLPQEKMRKGFALLLLLLSVKNISSFF